MKRTLQIVASLVIVVMAAGCHFTTPEGRALKLGQYDSILVQDVQLAPEVSEQQLGPLLKGYTEVAALESSAATRKTNTRIAAKSKRFSLPNSIKKIGRKNAASFMRKSSI